MTRSHNTGRALLTSALALLLCVAMLIGSTFAWFTDTAETAVNKIQAGELKVQIVDKAGNDLEGTSLTWTTKDNRYAEEIFWEPGATYELTPFKIKNNGNLALKYKVIVNGISGDSKLLDAIEFTATKGNTAVSLSGFEGKLLPEDKTAGEGEEAGTSDVITIKGQMKTDAGNEYQKLSADGIGITVIATQYTYEYDSTVNTYDKDAEYPVVAKVTKTVKATSDTVNSVEVAKVTEQVALTATETVAGTETPVVKATVPENVLLDKDTTAVTLNVTETKTPADVEVKVEDGQTSKSFEVEVTGVSTENTTPITVELYVGKGLLNPVLYHNDTNVEYETYDPDTGIMTFKTTSFSPFTVVSTTPAAKIGDTSYASLAEAITAAGSDTVTITMLRDSIGNGINVAEGSNFTIDFGGHTYTIDKDPLAGSTGTETQCFQLLKDSTLTFKNGAIVADNTGVLMMVQNYSNLTLDNMVLDATRGTNEVGYVLSNNCGDVTIKDTTITAKSNGVAFDVFGGFSTYGDVTVTVKGSSVINGIVEVARQSGTNNNKNTLVISGGTFNDVVKKVNGDITVNETAYSVTEDGTSWTVTKK